MSSYWPVSSCLFWTRSLKSNSISTLEDSSALNTFHSDFWSGCGHETAVVALVSDPPMPFGQRWIIFVDMARSTSCFWLSGSLGSVGVIGERSGLSWTSYALVLIFSMQKDQEWMVCINPQIVLLHLPRFSFSTDAVAYTSVGDHL